MASRNAQEPKGARFYKADLHTHTPGSKDFEDRGVTADSFVQAALSKGLEIIAVTDHNTAEWIEGVLDAAKGTGLFVFPGVEITTPICHTLALFDPSVPMAKLNDFLVAVGITSEKRGRQDALADQPEMVLQKIKEYGGLAIASHANSSNGLLRHPKGQYRQKIYHRADLAALEFSAQDDIENFTTGKIPGYGRKACVQGSDAHGLASIGQRFTYLKMDGVSLRGIEQAFLDYEVRIRFPWDLQSGVFPRVKKMVINQGFFGGASFEFHPNLNCFVGGKGVGKSTVVEFMRYAFDDLSAIDDIAQDTRGKVSSLLGEGGKVMIEYVDYDGEEKVVEREAQPWDTDRTVRTAHGTPAAIIARPVFFSQGELTRIAASPIAQLELMDRYLDVSTENEAERQLCDQLYTNAAKLQEANNQTKQIEEELNGRETGKVATGLKYRALEKNLKNPTLAEFPKWESEKRFLDAVVRGLKNAPSELNMQIDKLNLDGLFPLTLAPDSPNYRDLKRLIQIVDGLGNDLGALKHRFKEVIDSRLAEIQAITKAWEPLFREKKREHDEILEKLGGVDVRKAQANLRKLKERLDELEGKEKDLRGLEKEVKQSRNERKTMLADLAGARRRRFEKRNAKASQWQDAFQGKIKVNVVFCGARGEYGRKLRALQKGAMLRDPELNAIAKVVDPGLLVQMVEGDQFQLLAQTTGIKPENAKKLLDTLRLRNLWSKGTSFSY
jgi:predicted metal-dependent phosphoesterase TrpH